MFALVTPSFNRIRNYLAESSSESEKEDADEEEEGMTLKKALSVIAILASRKRSIPQVHKYCDIYLRRIPLIFF